MGEESSQSCIRCQKSVDPFVGCYHIEDIISGSYANYHYNSEGGNCSLRFSEKLSKKAAAARDIVKSTFEKETPVTGKGSGKGTAKKSRRELVEI